MGSNKSARKKTSEKCAANVMETLPIVMRFIRADMQARKFTELSIPQFRTLAFLDRNPGASSIFVTVHGGVHHAHKRQSLAKQKLWVLCASKYRT